jgi:hypothetical protein
VISLADSRNLTQRDKLNHIEEYPQETRRLIGLDYTDLQQLIENVAIFQHD